MRKALVVLCVLAACGDDQSTNDMLPPDMSAHVDMTPPFDLSVIADLSSDFAVADLIPFPDDGPHPDMAQQPLLTVNNTIAWCTVTVTIGGVATSFGTDFQTFNVPSGTTVTLHAVPKPTFFPVIWTGVSTQSGSNATYIMTSAPSQSVTACCPENSSGLGC
jgi:hypothetical protein